MDTPSASQVKTVKTAKLPLYVQELRAPFLSASILPMIFGGILASTARPTLILLTLLCGSLVHLASNTLNDYFDFASGADSKEVGLTPFSGGSGLLREEKLLPGEVLSLSIGLIVLALLSAGLILLLSPGKALVILAIGLTGLVLGIVYTAPPFKLSYRGLGEIAIFVTFGPIPVVGACYIASGTLSSASFVASLPFGLMTTAILWINQFPDFETDKRAGKRTLLVQMGPAKGRYVYLALLFLAALTLVVGVMLHHLPQKSLLGLFFLAPAIPAARILFKNFDAPEGLVPAMGLTIAAHAVLGILMIAGVVL